MAFAPHTNNEVQAQLRAGIVPTTVPMIFGCFREKEHGNAFEYAERRHPDDNFAPEFPHIIYVGNGETRLAKVLETVAYVITNEDDNGNPTIEKWQIKNHNHYDTAWVR